MYRMQERLAVLAVSAATSILFVMPHAAPAQQQTSKPACDICRISPVHSRKCLDIEDGNRNDRARALQYSCHGGANQLFSFVERGGFFQIKAKHSGKCLAIDGDSREDRARVIQQTCGDGESQRFGIERQEKGSYRIIARHSRKCLEIENGSREDRAYAQQNSCGADTRQQWRIR